jgi:diadenosine tetraphosphatase ApaH/serine/threonine PP2A family protein phosphatase
MGAIGSFPLDGFNELAREAALWTGEVIGNGEKEYLRSLPTVYRAADFVVTHGSLEEPEDFNYILNRADAVRSMELMDSALLFIGHSHVPCIYDFEMTGKRIVNAGSVGQPRNGDPRANFVIYDSDTSAIEMVKVSYDVEKARKKIIDAGLPIFLGDRLLKGQ